MAEGKGHRSDKEFRHFLFHARGSLMELETQILLAGKLQYLSAEQSTLRKAPRHRWAAVWVGSSTPPRLTRRIVKTKTWMTDDRRRCLSA
ncbi:MAG: four helix bundle protein [Candidatus Sulfotelmatobacter sp.]